MTDNNEDLVAVYDELFMAISDEAFYDDILEGVLYDTMLSILRR